MTRKVRSTARGRTEGALGPRLPQTTSPPTTLNLPIIFQSNHFVIVDKPAGLPSHPARGATLSVEACFPNISRRKDGPWLANRLDRDTSGCLLIALRKRALISAQAAFAAQKVTKIYWAIVSGKITQTNGEINAPLSRYEKNGKWRMRVNENGAPSLTSWRVLKTRHNTSLIELQLRTGRTHQARVHCAAMGHPILGDAIYGIAVQGARHALHCRQLSFDDAGQAVTAIAPPPPMMANWFDDFAQIP